MPNPNPDFRTVAQMWAFYRQAVVEPAVGCAAPRFENLMRLSYLAGSQDMLRALLAVGAHDDDAVWARALHTWADELGSLAAEVKRVVDGPPRRG